MSGPVFSELNVSQRQELVRIYTDSAERWLRHFVHSVLVPHIGQNYITGGAWKNDLKKAVVSKMSVSGDKFPREIDATTFDQVVGIICHPNYWSLFKDGLLGAYPEGIQEARNFLVKLQDIRNEVAHLRPVSTRQLEQAICYSNDLSESIKGWFQKAGMANEFNVPTFLSFVDSLGNRGVFTPNAAYFRGQDLSGHGKARLYPGEVLTVELEVDPSFSFDTYDVTWHLKTAPCDRGEGIKAVIPITSSHISQRMELQFRLVTHNRWHRSPNGDDDVMDLYYCVPPGP